MNCHFWLLMFLLFSSLAAQLTLEGEGVNLRVTSPAATLALTMMYLRSNNASVAARFVIPASGFALNLVHPHLLLLRVLGRSLVMWDTLQPTEAWIQAQLPPLLQVRVIRGDMIMPSCHHQSCHVSACLHQCPAQTAQHKGCAIYSTQTSVNPGVLVY